MKYKCEVVLVGQTNPMCRGRIMDSAMLFWLGAHKEVWYRGSSPLLDGYLVVTCREIKACW